jgi:tetratricopeptide (TPR) repeat protein
MHEKVLEKRERIFGEDHPYTLKSMHEIGVSLSQLGRHQESLVMHENVLEKRERILGEDHLYTLRSMHDIGTSLFKLGRHQESLVMHEKVLEKRERILGEDHNDTLRSMHRVAVQQFNTGRYDEAHRTASRGLLLARKNGFEDVVNDFGIFLSQLDARQANAVAGTGSIEQKRVQEKIRSNKQQAEKVATEAAKLAATPRPPMTEKALDDLMAEFGLEEAVGKKKSGGGGATAKKGKGKEGGK